METINAESFSKRSKIGSLRIDWPALPRYTPMHRRPRKALKLSNWNVYVLNQLSDPSSSPTNKIQNQMKLANNVHSHKRGDKNKVPSPDINRMAEWRAGS